MLINSLLSTISKDIAIDLGTANTLVFVKDEGIVCNEPSIVAIRKHGNENKAMAVGMEAKHMLGRVPNNVIIIRPLKEGVIANFEVAEAMVRYFVHKAHKRKTMVRPRIIIGIPFGITEVEKRAVRESAESAGGREVYLIDEPMAAAIGAGLPITEPTGSMIVDIGGGTTEVAVISISGIVVSESIKVGGDKMDENIISYMKHKHNLLIGDRTSEQLKISLGSAYPNSHTTEKKQMEIRGRDLIAGLPRTFVVNEDEARKALQEPVSQIVNVIKLALEKTPPELGADLVERGVLLAGGGALLSNLDKLIHEETSLTVIVAENPLTSVVLGAGKVLENLTMLKKVLSV